MRLGSLRLGQTLVVAGKPKVKRKSWLDKLVKHPKTGNTVKVRSLPPDLQKKYKPNSIKDGPELGKSVIKKSKSKDKDKKKDKPFDLKMGESKFIPRKESVKDKLARINEKKKAKPKQESEKPKEEKVEEPVQEKPEVKEEKVEKPKKAKKPKAEKPEVKEEPKKEEPKEEIQPKAAQEEKKPELKVDQNELDKALGLDDYQEGEDGVESPDYEPYQKLTQDEQREFKKWDVEERKKNGGKNNEPDREELKNKYDALPDAYKMKNPEQIVDDGFLSKLFDRMFQDEHDLMSQLEKDRNKAELKKILESGAHA